MLVDAAQIDPAPVRILNVVGARPHFVKLAPLVDALNMHHDTVLVHTGQHYDWGMSGALFEELHLPVPDHHLDVGSGSHGVQTARMLERIENILRLERPDVVLVFGDTNTTLAAALAAAKLGLRVAHVEAGLRSFKKTMPEEINRILTDHVSNFLFCPTATAVCNLKREGIVSGVHLVGDVMYDLFLRIKTQIPDRDTFSRTSVLPHGSYTVCTIHRAENTSSPERLRGIIEGLVATSVPVVFPVHPRTRGILQETGLASLLGPSQFFLCPPVPYLTLLALVHHSEGVVTDSGGIQKEAFFLERKCTTVREETEWTETTEDGWNEIVGTDADTIATSITREVPNTPPRKLFGDGRASERIATLLVDTIQ